MASTTCNTRICANVSVVRLPPLSYTKWNPHIQCPADHVAFHFVLLKILIDMGGLDGGKWTRRLSSASQFFRCCFVHVMVCACLCARCTSAFTAHFNYTFFFACSAVRRQWGSSKVTSLQALKFQCVFFKHFHVDVYVRMPSFCVPSNVFTWVTLKGENCSFNSFRIGYIEFTLPEVFHAFRYTIIELLLCGCKSKVCSREYENIHQEYGKDTIFFFLIWK